MLQLKRSHCIAAEKLLVFMTSYAIVELQSSQNSEALDHTCAEYHKFMLFSLKLNIFLEYMLLSLLYSFHWLLQCSDFFFFLSFVQLNKQFVYPFTVSHLRWIFGTLSLACFFFFFPFTKFLFIVLVSFLVFDIFPSANSNHSEPFKTQIRSWIFVLLKTLNISHIVEATKLYSGHFGLTLSLSFYFSELFSPHSSAFAKSVSLKFF